jgi:hypothetical protein
MLIYNGGNNMPNNKINQLNKKMSIRVTKKLEEEINNIAEGCEYRVKAIVRDELEEEYRTQVYASYSPVTDTGKAIQKHNERNKHQKKLSYHHTGIFASSVKALIDKHTVKIVIEDKQYPDGATTEEVYEWLTKGTAKEPTNGDSYSYKNGAEWSRYHSLPRHPFEYRTRVRMKVFLDGLASDISNNPKYYAKYKRKSREK